MADRLVEGATCPPFVDQPLSVNDFVRYQGASGDFNPIHHDTTFAERAGQPGPFAVGMRQAGVLASYVSGWLGQDNLRRFRVQFREQAWPGDVLTYTAAIASVRPNDASSVVEVELLCTRDGGGVHLRGWASFVF